eukprot:403362261
MADIESLDSIKQTDILPTKQEALNLKDLELNTKAETVRSKNDREFYDGSLPYSERILQRLNSQHLNNNPQFNMMKKAIRAFYESKECKNSKSYVSILYRSLVSMMISLAQVKDFTLAQKNNEKLFEWFDLKRRKLLGLPSKVGPSFQNSPYLQSTMKRRQSQTNTKTLLYGVKSSSSLINQDFEQEDQQSKTLTKDKSYTQSQALIQIKSTQSLVTSPDYFKPHSNVVMGLHDYDKFILTSKQSKIKFDVNSRSPHPDFQPAKDRILDFKRRQLVRQDSENFNQGRNLSQSALSQNRKILVGKDNQHRQVSITDNSRPETAATNNLNPTSSMLSQNRPGTQQTGMFLNFKGNQSIGSFMSPNKSQASFFTSPQVNKYPVQHGFNTINQDFGSFSNVPMSTASNAGEQIRPFSQQSYAFRDIRSRENQPRRQKQQTSLSIDKIIAQPISQAFSQKRRVLDSQANFYTVEPSSDKEDLKLTRFWFANMNKELMQKRSDEEKQVILNEWSVAKQRMCEEITSKQERFKYTSDPSKVAVMIDKERKVMIEKIYKNQHEFLDSEESSLNTTFDSEKEREREKQQADAAAQLMKKPTIKGSQTSIAQDYGYDNEYDYNRRQSDIDSSPSNQQIKKQQTIIDSPLIHQETRKKKEVNPQAKFMDFSIPQTDQDYPCNDNEQKPGQAILSINKPLEESSEEDNEPDEFGRIPKPKQVLPFNALSLAGQDQKRLKILKIRQNKGELIRASIGTTQKINEIVSDGVIDNVFINQSNPDTLTMSVYNRPVTSPYQNISGLNPPKDQMLQSQQIYTTKSRKLNTNYQGQQDLFSMTQQLGRVNDNPRPKTVGYTFSPDNRGFGRNKLMMEDRNAHIGGSILEQHQEIQSITQYLTRESLSGTFNNLPQESSKQLSTQHIQAKSLVSLPFSIQAISKAILLPDEDIDLNKKYKEHPNPQAFNLMPNPFPKLVKAKKGKKGKK